MKYVFSLGLGAVFALLMISACSDPNDNVTQANTGDAVEVETAEGKTLKFDQSTSKVEWRGTKTGGGHDGGFEKFEGTAIVSEDGKALKQVKVTIDMNSLWSDEDRKEEPDPKLSNHLKSDDFLSVSEYPNAEFVSSEIKEGGDGGKSHTVTGNLTLRGVTKSVTFPADITVKDGKVTAKAEFKIDRHDWNVSFKIPGGEVILHDDVAIKLDIATK
ncbi:MAG: YceI family protein [Planctomycetota bacterium]